MVTIYKAKVYEGSSHDGMKGAPMRYSKEHSDKTRDAVLGAAAVKFRENGFTGVGINAIAATAEVTSGAIYSQFASKDALFNEVVEAGMRRLIAGLERFKAEGGEDWVLTFIRYYLGAEHVGNVGGGCGLPTLSGDVTRSDQEAKAVYRARLLEAAAVIADKPDQKASAVLLLSSLLGAVILARASGDDDLRQGLSDALCQQAKASAYS
jgi:TetR/AcrR family transcriptional regulator, transcriptional repressor for nem operon